MTEPPSARCARACRPAGASRPGTARWVARTGAAPWRTPRRSRGTNGRRRPARRRPARPPVGGRGHRRRPGADVRAGSGPGRWPARRPLAGSGRGCRAARPRTPPKIRRPRGRRDTRPPRRRERLPVPSALAATWAPSTGRSSPVTSRAPSGARHDDLEPAGGEGEGGRLAPVDQARDELGPLGVGARLDHHGGGHHRGQERSGDERPTRLLEHHGQLRVAESLAAVPLWYVDAQPPLGGELLPGRLQVLMGGVEHRPRHRRGAVRVQPPPNGRGRESRAPRRWRSSWSSLPLSAGGATGCGTAGYRVGSSSSHSVCAARSRRLSTLPFWSRGSSSMTSQTWGTL